jgi:transglutaminase-like putative cysteine protease
VHAGVVEHEATIAATMTMAPTMSFMPLVYRTVTRSATASLPPPPSRGPFSDGMPRWIIADTVQPDRRVELLDSLANDAMREGFVRELAALVPRSDDPRTQAANLLAFVHAAFRYRPDPGGVEVFQDVRETIANGGDCEDLATLFVALARLLGLEARVVWLDQQIHGAALNHVFAQVLVDGRWLDVEASIAGSELGESPAHAARRLRS